MCDSSQRSRAGRASGQYQELNSELPQLTLTVNRSS